MINRKAFLLNAIEEGFKNDVSGYPLSLKHSKGVDLINYKIYGKSVQDGTPTPDNPVEIQSVGDKTINLYGGEQDIIINSLLNYNPPSLFEAFEAGKTYTMFCYIDNTEGTAVSRFRMSVGKITDGVNGWNYNYSKTIIAGSKGWSLCAIPIPDNYNGQLNLQLQGTGTVIFKDIMLVEGSYTLNNLPSYEPYGYKIPVKVNDIITNIYLDEPLRKVGDYADYIDFENKKVVRKIGNLWLNGSENFWSRQSLGKPVASILKTSIGTSTTIMPEGSNLCFSSRFISENIWTKLSVGEFYIGGSYINFNLDNTNNLTDFKEWLSTNNVNLVYPLTTPTEETIELPNIPTHKGTNIIKVDTIVEASNLNVSYKSFEKE